MIKYKFSREINQEFSTKLKKKVKIYFQERGVSPNGNSEMFIKSGFALSVYIVPYLVIIFGGIHNIWILSALWACMGLGVALIGTSVMHDALHGSYSKKKSVNLFMGLSSYLIGADPTVWKIQHNVLHHTYTNIEHADEDIAYRYVLRFSPHQPRKWFHSYQHIYALIFYSTSTLIWVTAKDLVKMITYREKKLVKPGREFWQKLSRVISLKLLYHLVFLILPIILLEIPVWQTLLLFLLMHLIAGILLSVVFQTAHVMPTSSFVMQEDIHIEENWSVHQLLTTSNYAMDNKWVCWLFGGLNFQIEHHLFPHVCHIHYPEISKIVQSTAAEYGLPYYSQKSMGGALIAHLGMLRKLGNPSQEPTEATELASPAEIL